jgi:hypothetical protein
VSKSELADLAAAETAQLTPAEKAAAETNRLNAEQRAARAKTRNSALDIDGGATADPELHPTVALAEEIDLATAVQEIRAKRQAWGAGLQQKLALPIRRGYHRHWFNDSGNRIEDAKSSGWAHIKGSDGKPIERVVGTARSGQPLKAFAMELPEVLWLEDLDAKNKVAEDQIEQVRTKPFRAPPGAAQRSDAGKFYSVDDAAGPVGVRIGSRA